MNTDIIHMLKRILTVLAAMPFAFQLWGFFVCNRYKNAATNIQNTNREIFRSIRLRYTNSTKLNIPLSDTDSFVAKYFYGKGGPFRFVNGLERMGAIFCCMSLLGTTAMYIRGHADTTRIIAIIASTICYYLFRLALSTEKPMALTLSFTKDFLDNTLKHRLSPEPLRSTKSDTPATTAVEKAASVNRQADDKPDILPDIAQTSTDEKSAYNESSDIIEAVLQEFLA